MNLEEQLKVVKKGVHARLSHRELTWQEYKACVQERSQSVHLVEGDCEFGHNWDVVFTIARSLFNKLDLEEVRGVENKYVKFKDKALIGESKKDVELLEHVRVNTLEYLQTHVGTEEIRNSQFNGLIRNYVFENYNLADMSGTVSYMQGLLSHKFNVIRDNEPLNPEKQYLKTLSETIEKL